LTSIATVITLSQSAYTYPPFSYTDQSNNQPPNITGIIVPFLPIEVVAVVAEAGLWMLDSVALARFFVSGGD
jgi:hypothetical protein